jgi:transcriptional regulator with XRE-family HTH domain
VYGRGVLKSNSEKIVQQVVALLCEQRENRAWSQRKLASNAGVDPKTVSLIERGRRSPTLYTLCLLAGAMNFHLSDLLKAAELRVQTK